MLLVAAISSAVRSQNERRPCITLGRSVRFRVRFHISFRFARYCTGRGPVATPEDGGMRTATRIQNGSPPDGNLTQLNCGVLALTTFLPLFCKERRSRLSVRRHVAYPFRRCREKVFIREPRNYIRGTKDSVLMDERLGCQRCAAVSTLASPASTLRLTLRTI